MNKIVLLSASLLVTACATVGPDYRAPDMMVNEGWLEPGIAEPVEAEWWTAFDDEMLTALIERASAESRDLREATARLREARAQRDAVAGRRLPNVEASAGSTENRLSETGQLPIGGIPGIDPAFSLFDLGFDSSWEIDFWGRTQRALEASDARAQAAEEARRDVLVTLKAEVARAYIDLRAAQADLVASEVALSSDRELARLTGLLRDGGEATSLDLQRALGEVDESDSLAAAARSRIASAAYHVATLVGARPHEIVPELLDSKAVPAPPDRVLVGVRSDLLTRRPDIRRAERDLAAATAEIGVKTADLFPSFSLVGSVGTQVREAGDLFSEASLRYGIGPQLNWPIFSGGRVRAEIRAADARAEAAAARYEGAVISALNESESAINVFLRAQERYRSATAAMERQRGIFALQTRRYERGEDDKLAFEGGRKELAEMERRAADARAEASRAAVALYKALGGGWEQPV